MNKDFLNLTQPNPDYFSGLSIWKNNPNHFASENFVTPKLENLCEGSLVSAFENFKIPQISNPIGCAGTMDFRATGATEMIYGNSSLGNLTYERNLLSPGTIFAENDYPNWHIVDAGVSFKSLAGSYDLENLYTTSAVATEANGNLSHFLPSDNISLHSFTPREFKESGNTVTLTSPFGEISTVVFERETNSTAQLHCGHVVAATLTNTATGEGVTICGNVLYSKSTNDFGLAVYGIAFHSTANIITEDSCLGCAFGHLYSLRPSNNTSWDNYIKIKNNSSCLHNH